MDRKRKVIEISSDESFSDLSNKQIKHEFQNLKCAPNGTHPIISQDQNSQGVEGTSASKCTLPPNNNLLHSQVVQHKLEKHWNYSFCGVRYFINDPDPTIVPDQNTKHAEKTPLPNTTKEVVSLDDTSSQKLYTKIFMNENFIEIVRNNNGSKQEQGIEGIRYDKNDAHITVSKESNFQKGSNACHMFKDSRRLTHADLLPLIEILSRNLYHKIFIDENFIRIVRNRGGRQMNNGFRGKRHARRDTNHRVFQESMIQKSPIASANVEQRPLHEILPEKQLTSKRHDEDETNVFPERKKLNNEPHIKIDEDQNTNTVEKPSEDKLMLPPSDASSQNLYRKILISESFIGIVRKRHRETQGNSSGELSIKDLLPLIQILSQNLFRTISIGTSFIRIHRNRHGE